VDKILVFACPFQEYKKDCFMNKLLDYISKKLAEALIKRLDLDGFKIAVLEITPGDVIVVKSERPISAVGWVRVKAQMQDLFPENKVVALEDSLELFLMRTRERAKPSV
jgi:hypothetical protein